MSSNQQQQQQQQPSTSASATATGASSPSTSSAAPFWKLSNGKNGEKYLIFPTNRRRKNINLNDQLSDSETINDRPIEIKTYKLRWFILIVICLINISNAINWICFSPIADFIGKFYNVNYTQVNLLSLVYLICTVPTGFVSFLIIDYFGIRSSITIAGWFNFVGSAIRVLSSIDEGDGTPLIPSNYKYLVLMVGQVICSLAQPFILFVSTKFANTWFNENQRALANTVALSSNTFGILIGAFASPLIVEDDKNYVFQLSLLNFITCGVSLVPAILTAFVTRSTPPTPSSYSSYAAMQPSLLDQTSSNDWALNGDPVTPVTFREKFNEYIAQIGKLMKCGHFIILVVSFGFGLGLFNALTTLIQQVLCIHGYTDDDCGIFGGVMILSGIIGSLIAGIFVDKTKKFEEIAKLCFCIGAVVNILFAILQNYNNDLGLMKYLITICFGAIGFFGLPLLPVSLKV